jgi:ATP-binding cassette subfamily B protein RaxB
MIYQSEAAECGLASMAMAANYHGHQLDLTTLRNRYSVSLKGANLQQLRTGSIRPIMTAYIEIT